MPNKSKSKMMSDIEVEVLLHDELVADLYNTVDASRNESRKTRVYWATEIEIKLKKLGMQRPLPVTGPIRHQQD